MESHSDELKLALVDVRKAFRLLFLYQRRILDFSKTFANEMGLRPYSAVYGFNRPTTVNPFDKWVWDMLPMYRVSFLFLSLSTDQNQTKKGEWLLAIHLVSDTGYPDGISWKKGEPNPLDFPVAEDSFSRLGIYAFKSDIDERRNWQESVWRPAINYLPKYPSDWNVVTIEKIGVSICGAQFDLSDLSNKEAMLRTASQFKEVLARDLQLSLP